MSRKLAHQALLFETGKAGVDVGDEIRLPHCSPASSPPWEGRSLSEAWDSRLTAPESQVTVDRE